MMPTLLFAYGTLAPEGPVGGVRDGWVADRVRGRLYDLGPYPALRLRRRTGKLGRGLRPLG